MTLIIELSIVPNGRLAAIEATASDEEGDNDTCSPHAKGLTERRCPFTILLNNAK